MSDSKAASRYAKSLIDLATERDLLEEVKNDMLLFSGIVKSNSELEAILKNPIVPLDKKSGILEHIFRERVSPLTSSYLKLVVSKGRSSILLGTADSFISQYNQIKGIVLAEVISATALTESNREEIQSIVKRESGANRVFVKEKVDERLIGGFILKVGDRQFDASISGGLNKLKKEFSQAVV